MSSQPGAGGSPRWEHRLEPLLPVEVAPLQRRYIAGLPIPTLTDLDIRLRDGIKAVGVKVGGEAVAFALIQPAPPDGLPGPLLVALAAPGQASTELRAFFRAVVEELGVRALWGRSDDCLLLEVLMLEGWRFHPVGPLLVLEEVVPPEEREGVELRHLSPADLDTVAGLVARVPEADEPLRDRNELRKLLQDRMLDGLFFQGTLVALSLLIPQLQPRFVSLRVLVDPGYRRQGFGRLLAADCALEELAAARIVVHAFPREEGASRRLIESLGARSAAMYFVATPS